MELHGMLHVLRYYNEMTCDGTKVKCTTEVPRKNSNEYVPLRYVFIGIFTWNMALLYHVGVQSSLLLACKDHSKQSSQM